MYLLKVIVFAIALVVASAKSAPPLSQEFIDEINEKAETWTAGQNFDPNTSMEYIKGLLGTILIPSTLPLKEIEVPTSFPDSFDSREQWPNCPTIKEIRDQGECGSCWAFGAVEVMSDRYCIQSDQQKHFRFSANDLNACDDGSFGCDGGYIGSAWQFWRSDGIVSGGPYGSNEGCQPYVFPKCRHRTTEGPYPACRTRQPTPDCTKTCVPGYNKTYEDDKNFGIDAYQVKNDVGAIQTEIMTKGPVEAGFLVYEDFMSYKTGVYKHVQGKYLGGHAIKILGWGVEEGVPYWLVTNSWNEYWGDKGFFKILRGQNECIIENAVAAGNPKYKQLFST